MKVKLMGLQDVDFRDKDGVPVVGVKAHIIHKQSNVVGIATTIKWFSLDNSFYQVIKNAPIGCTLDLEYGPKDKLMGVSVLPNILLDLDLNPVQASVESKKEKTA